MAGAVERAPARPSGRRRGRAALHDVETLLDLVGDTARLAAADGEARTAATVSMPVFNRVRPRSDEARGLTGTGARDARTPTAEAIQMRMSKHAGRPVRWAEIVELGLRAPAERTMWLASASREPARDDVDDELISLALRRVAAELQAATVTDSEYEQTRTRLLAADRARHGDGGVLAEMLPSTGQIMHAAKSWNAALTTAGLQPARAMRNAAPKNTPGQKGVPLPQAMAFYGVLNGVWASLATLRDFAKRTGFAIPDHAGVDWGRVIVEAHDVLIAHGHEAPSPVRPKQRGRGKRLTYLYPATPIPGAPSHRRSPDRDQRRVALHREMSVLSLQAWLLRLPAGDRPSQNNYRPWTVGTSLVGPSNFPQHGGFTALMHEAREANNRARRAGKALDPDEIEARIRELRVAIDTPTPMDFAHALAHVIAGPHAECTPAGR